MTAREKLAAEIATMSEGQLWAMQVSIAAENRLRHIVPTMTDTALEQAYAFALSRVIHPDEVKK